MSYIIIYFSGTGNTELIANEIAKRLKGEGKTVEILSIENTAQLENLSLENKILGFGYPIYKFSYPEIFQSVLEMINISAKHNKYFQFSTYTRFQANSFSDFANQLNSDKFDLIAQREFKAPSCGIASRKPCEDYAYRSVMFFEDDIQIKLDEFVNDILTSNSKMQFKNTNSFTNKLKKQIVQDVEITRYPYLSINQDTCISCGLCARKCPVNNLVHEQDSNQIQILDHVHCLHCLRCMHHCPVNAISFGPLTEGPNQYTFTTRNQLFNKTIHGYHEPYWQIFNKIIRKWRFHTVVYWLKQKCKNLVS